MLSKLGKIAFGISAVFTAGCGILGQKTPFDGNIIFKSTSGCLNQFGPQFESFLVGDVAQKDLESTWSCIDSALTQFQTFARGSDPQGFTPLDVKMLLQSFLITNKRVDDSFVRVNLELKAALFGGSSQLLSYQELGRLKELINFLKTESSRLIPFMKARKQGVDQKGLVSLSLAVSESGKRLASFLEQSQLQSLKKESVKILLGHLKDTFGWNIPVELIDAVFAAKEAALGGSLDEIEGSTWKKIFHLGGTGAGSLLAFKGYVADSQMELITDLLKAHEGTTYQVLDWQGGMLKHEKIDRIINELPEQWRFVDGEVLKRTLRIFASRVLFARHGFGFDKASIQTLYRILEQWKRYDGHVDGIWKLFPQNTNAVSPTEFRLKAMEYLSKIDPVVDQVAVKKVVEISQKYRPMFEFNQNEIKLAPGVELSVTHMKKMVLFHTIATHLLSCYSQNSGVSADSFKEIFDEFGPIAGQLNLIDVTMENLYLKRFREADLFTFASDGNQLVDIDEATYYLAVIASSFTLSRKIKTDAEVICATSDGSKDRLQWNWMDVKCFRTLFKNSIDKYYRMFPMLYNYYSRLSPSDRDALLANMEKGYRLNGFSDVPVASYDTQALTGYLHYIETLFQKYDENQSQTLDKREVLKIFPVFRKLLADSAPKLISNNKTLLEAAFTYVIRFGQKPEGLWRTIHFVIWTIGRPFWKINADRGDVYAIVPTMMATPPSKTEKMDVFSEEQQLLIDHTSPDDAYNMGQKIDPTMFEEK